MLVNRQKQYDLKQVKTGSIGPENELCRHEFALTDFKITVITFSSPIHTPLARSTAVTAIITTVFIVRAFRWRSTDLATTLVRPLQGRPTEHGQRVGNSTL